MSVKDFKLRSWWIKTLLLEQSIQISTMFTSFGCCLVPGRLQSPVFQFLCWINMPAATGNNALREWTKTVELQAGKPKQWAELLHRFTISGSFHIIVVIVISALSFVSPLWQLGFTARSFTVHCWCGNLHLQFENFDKKCSYSCLLRGVIISVWAQWAVAWIWKTSIAI